MQLRSALIGITLTILLSSCSTLGPMAKDALLGSERGMKLSANISKGDAEGTRSASQNANTAILVDTGMEGTYEGPVGTVVNEGELPIHLLITLILLAGWAIPSPSEMGKGCVRAISVIRSNGRGSDGTPRR